jgi:hypothetical protein
VFHLLIYSFCFPPLTTTTKFTLYLSCVCVTHGLIMTNVLLGLRLWCLWLCLCDCLPLLLKRHAAQGVSLPATPVRHKHLLAAEAAEATMRVVGHTLEVFIDIDLHRLRAVPVIGG